MQFGSQQQFAPE